MQTGPRRPDPGAQVDGAPCDRPRYCDDARSLLQYVWALAGMLCGKYLVAMLGLWLLLLAEPGGRFGKPFTTDEVMAQLEDDDCCHCGPLLEACRLVGLG
jgi:hypothetical protein